MDVWARRIDYLNNEAARVRHLAATMQVVALRRELCDVARVYETMARMVDSMRRTVSALLADRDPGDREGGPGKGVDH